VQIAPPMASPQREPTPQLSPAVRPSPQATAAHPGRIAMPTPSPVPPRTGNGPEGGGASWVFPLVGGIAGIAAASVAAALGIRRWRQHRGRPAAGR
jgi:hypothetical protein